MSDHDRQAGESMSDAYVFLFGADMNPTTARSMYPGARFVARARIPGGPSEYPWFPACDPANWPEGATSLDVWGILLQLPEGTSPPIAPLRQVVTDDGRSVDAFVGTDGATVGDAAAVLAAARYWELPPPYVRRLQATIAPPGGSEASEGTEA